MDETSEVTATFSRMTEPCPFEDAPVATTAPTPVGARVDKGQGANVVVGHIDANPAEAEESVLDHEVEDIVHLDGGRLAVESDTLEVVLLGARTDANDTSAWK